MRFVDIDWDNFDFPKSWQKRANKAKKQVTSAHSDDKSSLINDNNKIWGDLKSELEKVIGTKCWYTEAPLAGSDVDVDHYRPKNAVRGVVRQPNDEKHPGYWWLAFKPENYRYSSIYANRLRQGGGKGDLFPLYDEGKRAWCENDNCDAEQPLLIDPCKLEEVGYITFAPNGKAIPRYEEKTNPRKFKMADESITTYNINHHLLVKARLSLKQTILENYEEAKDLSENYDFGDSKHDKSLRKALKYLRNACNPKAPYSAFAKALLEPYKTEEFMEHILQ